MKFTRPSTLPPSTAREQLVLIPLEVDCASCASKLRAVLTGTPGVLEVEILYVAQAVRVRFDASQVDASGVRQAIERAGFRPASAPVPQGEEVTSATSRRSGPLLLFGGMAALVLAAVVVGEWMGLFAAVTHRIPLPFGVALALAIGYPSFRKVLVAARRRMVTAHALVTVGALAALLVGEWVTALLIVIFMRLADRIERFTARRGREALRELTAMVPPVARVLRGGEEVAVALSELNAGDEVVIRPGERMPVDGEVVAGHAAVDAAAVTGESLPIEAAPGTRVFAAALVHGGALRVRVERVGEDSTFGRVLRMVEEADASRGEVQKVADRVSAWYLPVVLTIALLTWLIRGDVLAAAAVLVIACSCAFALATPVAMIASIAAAAQRGLLIKGGRYIEALARADVLLLDKTGTVTTGRPRITSVIPLDSYDADEVLELAAAAEMFSEHPLAEAVRAAASERGLRQREPDAFEAVPGLGVRATIGNRRVDVGSSRLVADSAVDEVVDRFHRSGCSTLLVAVEGRAVGVLAASDTLRPDVPAALAQARELGIREIEILSGDNPGAVAALAAQLGVTYRAGLLPEDKIRAVEEYQARGHTVIMVGDGVNDAPALCRAHVGIALSSAGTDVALEAAHLTLMRDDWSLLPRAIRIAQRTMRTVRLNLGYTVVYNIAGLALAAAGMIPPIIAAAAHSVPDLVIVANSSRLLRPRDEPRASIPSVPPIGTGTPACPMIAAPARPRLPG